MRAVSRPTCIGRSASRIGLFETVVGRLQPILARLPRAISDAVLSGEDRDAGERASVVDAIEQQVSEAEGRGFDINAVTEDDLAMPARAPSPVTMEDLDRIIGSSDMMPPGTDVQPWDIGSMACWPLA